MTIYGVSLLAACYLAGILIGEILGWSMNIHTNVGGVGFAMMLLILIQSVPSTKKWFIPEIKTGIDFWNKMYIPVVIAMSATQNAYAAFSSGFIAILAGIVPTFICFAIIPSLAVKTGQDAKPE